MRKTMLLAVTVVAATIAVVAVMFPGLGFGQTTSIHGGTPTDVYTKEIEGVCGTLTPGGAPPDFMTQDFILDAPSNVLVYFTTGLSGLTTDEDASVNFILDFGTESISDSPSWDFPGNQFAKASGTVMWSFKDVPVGPHSVIIGSEIIVSPTVGGHGQQSQPSADFDNCALTVFVTPVAP